MIALWSEDNETVDSDPFAVTTGKVVALFAVGLTQERIRQDAAEFKDIQRICISRIVYDSNIQARNVRFAPVSYCDCGFIQGRVASLAPVEDIIVANGESWNLTSCDNFRFIGAPGIYRLHLNDITAIGKAQVYAEQYNISEIAPQVASLFFN